MKVAAVNRDSHDKKPRNNLLRDPNIPRVNDEYIAQVAEVIERRLTKNFSQEFNGTQNRFLGAVSKLDIFLWSHKFGCNSEPFW